MKRFLSITAMLFAATPAFADILTFSGSDAVDANCTEVPQAGSVTLPGAASVSVASVGNALRMQSEAIKGYCANVLVSDATDFKSIRAAAITAKDASGETIRTAISGTQNADGSTATAGMLFVIRMDVESTLGAPIGVITSNFQQALNQNTDQSDKAMTAEAGHGPLNSFIALSGQGGGARPSFLGVQHIVVTVDGRPGSTYGQVYYQGPDGQTRGPVTASSGVPAFIQNMIAIWYGDTNDTNMVALHKQFELTLLGQQ